MVPFLTILDQDIAIVEDMLDYISDNPESLKHLSFTSMLDSLYKKAYLLNEDESSKD